jgi:hypothetical protein
MRGLAQASLPTASGAQCCAPQDRFESMNHNDNITAGRYLISPITKMLGNGWYASSVSIRSGCGTGTHDRVLRLTRLFQTRVAAVRYATAEGLQWIGYRNTSVQGPALAAP